MDHPVVQKLLGYLPATFIGRICAAIGVIYLFDTVWKLATCKCLTPVSPLVLHHPQAARTGPACQLLGAAAAGVPRRPSPQGGSEALSPRPFWQPR